LEGRGKRGDRRLSPLAEGGEEGKRKERGVPSLPIRLGNQWKEKGKGRGTCFPLAKVMKGESNFTL